MIRLLASLLLQAVGCERTAAAAAAEAGWEAYRRGALPEAAARFAAADSLCRAFPDAQVGLGFVQLRAGENAAAERHFTAALRGDSAHGDAWYGLGLARERLRRHSQAITA